MHSPRVVEFDRFRVDFQDERMWCGDTHLPLTNKSFQVLRYLIENPGRLITRDELVNNIWSRRYVTDAAIAMCIKEIRSAIGDNAKSPQFIETVRGRGYRFIAPIAEEPSGVRSESIDDNTGAKFDGLCVGRSNVIKKLAGDFQSVLKKNRKIVLMGGESGIGKTTVVEAFVESLALEHKFQIGRGQCINFQGPDEPFHPVVEVLSGLCRIQGGEIFIEQLRRVAPTWVNQIHPPIQSDNSGEKHGNPELTQVTGRRRMRELSELIETASEQLPLVLILEDIHWCDASTLTWLNHLAGRRNPARLLVIATYRPIEAKNTTPSTNDLIQRLKVHNQYSEIQLDKLGKSDVSDYVSMLGNHNSAPDVLVQTVFDQSSGIPLFARMGIEYLISQNAIKNEPTGWVIQENWDRAISKIPRSISLFVESQINHLEPDTIQLLEVASVVGMKFSAAVVAACSNADQETIEYSLNSLSKKGLFVVSSEIQAGPFGVNSESYEFVHGVYREVLYERIPNARRSWLHINIGTYLETIFENSIKTVIADLCNHFSQGSDFEKAEKYLAIAGSQSFDQGAYEDAINLYSLALDTLSRSDRTGNSVEAEIEYLTRIGSAQVALKGFAWTGSAHVFSRVHELCQLPGNETEFVKSMYSVCLFHLDRAELEQASDIAKNAMEIAFRSSDGTDLMLAHRLMGTCQLFLGEFDSANIHLESALEKYNSDMHKGLRLDFATDVRISILCWLSRLLCITNQINRARELISETVVEAQNLNHAHSLAYALRESCFANFHVQDIENLENEAKLLNSLAQKEGYLFELAESQIYLGWVKCQKGDPKTAVKEISTGLQNYQSTGSEFQLPYLLTIAADAHMKQGNHKEALILVQGAIRRVEKSGEKWYAPKIHQTKNEIETIYDRAK